MTGRIAVTGAAGALGRAVVADLRAHGYAVVGADRSALEEPGVDAVGWDGRDLDTLLAGFAGCDALIHLAAIPQPWVQPDEVVFANNTLATFVALQAAARLGIVRVAIASSGSAYGTAWSPEPTHARYVPVDEDHPMDNADPYGLSKEVDERTAQMFCRRYPMSVAALRFHWICEPVEQRRSIAYQSGPRDWPSELRGLWGYVDRRDAARACRLAIEAAAVHPYGFQPMNIVAADPLSEVPVTELLAAHAPDIQIRGPLASGGGAFAIERAASVIGWRPEHSWRDTGG